MNPLDETPEETDARVIAIIAAELKRDPKTFDSRHTLGEAGISSLELIEILFALEGQLAIAFESNQQDFRLTTLQDLLNEVRRLLAPAGDAP